MVQGTREQARVRSMGSDGELSSSTKRREYSMPAPHLTLQDDHEPHSDITPSAASTRTWPCRGMMMMVGLLR